MKMKMRCISLVVVLAMVFSLCSNAALQVVYGDSITASTNASAFAYDTDSTKWYYDAAKWSNNNGLIMLNNGYFYPNRNITRAEVAYALYMTCKNGLNNTYSYGVFTWKNPFNDVSSSSYYYNAIVWAYERGIIEGYGNGYFGPNDPVTREQAAKMFAKAISTKEFSESEQKNTSSYGSWLTKTFKDSRDFGSWSYGYVSYIVNKGVMKGYDNGYFKPKGNITKAEFATMLYNYFG